MMNECTHNVYLLDTRFLKTPLNKWEQTLRKKCPRYEELRSKRYDKSKRPETDTLFKDYFSGLVEYLPTNENKDISESANICIYIFRKKKLSPSYKSAFNFLVDFINENDIKEIKFSKYDIQKMLDKEIDIVQYIYSKANHKINILIENI